jgi:Zn-dependent protease
MLPVFTRPRTTTTDYVLWRTWLSLGVTQRVELSVHLYLVLTVATITVLLGAVVLPQLFPGWSVAVYWLVGVSVATLDCLAGLAHELGHALVAAARGRRVYRITLYGLAAAARRSSGPSRRRDQFSIALAGPIGQLLLASVLLLVWRFAPIDNEPLRVATGLPALSNLLMGLANLLPLNPLDGGRVLTALLSPAIAATAQAESPLSGAIISRSRSES